MGSPVSPARGGLGAAGRLLAAAVVLAVASPATAAVTQGVELTGFVLRQEEGSGTMEIRARQARYEGVDTVRLEGVTASLLDGGVERLSLSGASGTYSGGRRTLLIEGGVTARTAEGLRLDASALEWDGEAGQVRGRGGVEVDGGGVTVRGERLEYTVSGRRAVLRGGVSGVLRLGGGSR